MFNPHLFFAASPDNTEGYEDFFVATELNGTFDTATSINAPYFIEDIATIGAVPDTQKINYFSNANSTAGQAFVHVTDPLEPNTSSGQPHEICAMFYVFDTRQALQECCGCPVTADGLRTLNITTDLASGAVAQSTTPPAVLQNGVIRIISAAPNATQSNPPIPTPGEGCDPKTDNCCDPTGGSGAVGLTLQPTVRAWATHPQTTSLTEEEFEDAPADVLDADNLASLCGDIQQIGSGLGVCTCGTGN